MEKAFISKAKKYVRDKMTGEPTGHDWFHVERVLRTAERLQAEEGGDLELIQMAALLHDLGDDQVFEFNETKGSLMLAGMMDILDVDGAVKEKIVIIVNEVQYDGPNTPAPKTIEGKIVRDADWLDDLGALGVARVFATGGNIGRILHDPAKPLRAELARGMHHKTKKQGTSFNYFYEKMFRLPDMMQTKAGRQIALDRVNFIRDFLKQFQLEWNGEA